MQEWDGISSLPEESFNVKNKVTVLRYLALKPSGLLYQKQSRRSCCTKTTEKLGNQDKSPNYCMYAMTILGQLLSPKHQYGKWCKTC